MRVVLMLLVLLLIMILLATLGIKIIVRRKERFARKEFYLFLGILGGAFALALPALYAFMVLYTPWQIIVGLSYLLLGMTYVYLYENYIWPFRSGDSGVKWILAILLVLMSEPLFVYVFNCISSVTIGLAVGISEVAFFLPLLFNETFARLLRIPDKIYNVWYYGDERFADHPVGIAGEELLLTVELCLKAGDEELTQIHARAASGDIWGQWFQELINDHNYRFPECPIDHIQEDGHPYGWIFYKTSFLGWRGSSIAYDKSMKENGLVTNCVVRAKRVGEYKYGN